jgi:hypothetical protein
MDEHPPQSPAGSSRDFLSWGRAFLKDALAKTNPPEKRRTSPLAADDPGRKRTTLLTEDVLAQGPRTSLSELARLNILFTDNQQRPLYQALGPNDAAFTIEGERHMLERCIGSLREVADRLSAVPDLVPRGQYQGLTLEQVIQTVTAKDLRAFFTFVKENPRFFVGRPLRFSEAFVAWVIDHGTARPAS